MQKDITLAWINFGDITQKIIDFHNQIRLQSDFYKKIQKIKRLKDKHILSENSNIERILIQENSLFFSDQQKFISQISIPFLQTDEACQLIYKTNWSFNKLKQGVKQQLAKEISGNQFVEKQKTITAISPAKIKQLFTVSGGELFDSIQNYEFSESLSLEQKTTLFCKIASRYNDELGHTGEYNISEGIEYAVIKEKK